MKKIVLLIITLLVLSGCGFRSKELNEETKQKIQQEISKINDKMSQDELENMMSVAKLNYDVNPEIGKMYFEKLVKYKPEASIYLSDYYYEKKDEVCKKVASFIKNGDCIFLDGGTTVAPIVKYLKRKNQLSKL